MSLPQRNSDNTCLQSGGQLMPSDRGAVSVLEVGAIVKALL